MFFDMLVFLLFNEVLYWNCVWLWCFSERSLVEKNVDVEVKITFCKADIFLKWYKSTEPKFGQTQDLPVLLVFQSFMQNIIMWKHCHLII